MANDSWVTRAHPCLLHELLNRAIRIDLEVRNKSIEHWAAFDISKRHRGSQPSSEVGSGAALQVEDVFHHKTFIHQSPTIARPYCLRDKHQVTEEEQNAVFCHLLVDDLYHGAEEQQLARRILDHCTLLRLRVLVRILCLPVPLDNIIHALDNFSRVECLFEEGRDGGCVRVERRLLLLLCEGAPVGG